VCRANGDPLLDPVFHANASLTHREVQTDPEYQWRRR
jgi:hypothetical protein